MKREVVAVLPEAIGVLDFCASYSISRSHFYALRRAGRAPQTIKVGTRTLITREAIDAWRSALSDPRSHSHAKFNGGEESKVRAPQKPRGA